MRSMDEEIARRLAEAQASGELSKAESYGKPMLEGDGWDDTPEALRMPFKILKDAGVVPREVEMFANEPSLPRLSRHRPIRTSGRRSATSSANSSRPSRCGSKR